MFALQAGDLKDASDADWSVYLLLARGWEEVGPCSRPFLHTLATDGSREEALAQGLAALRELGLHGEQPARAAD